MFSPAHSLTRSLFKDEELKWITIKPAIGDKWSACLQTLEGHSDSVRSVAFSHDSTRLASASYDNTIKIWDAGSAKCLQTLRIGKVLSNILFDSTGSYLHTNIGTITIDGSSALNMTLSVTDPQKPRYQGEGLGLDEVWITHNSENIVWLPSEYRPSCSAMSGKMIGVGVGSGKIWICKLKVHNA
jgi:WD40 repeat protein